MSADFETEDFRAFFHHDHVVLSSKESGSAVYTLGWEEFRQIETAVRAWRKAQALKERLANPQPWKCDECGHRKSGHLPRLVSVNPEVFGLGQCMVQRGCDCGEWRDG